MRRLGAAALDSARSRALPASRSPYFSRLERGREPAPALETLCACAAALDVQLAAFVEAMPGANLPRDIEHLRRQNLVVATAQAGGWTAIPEATLDEGRWSRSIDVLLSAPRAARRPSSRSGTCCSTAARRCAASTSKVQALRERLGPAWRVQGLLVVRGTHRNRALVRELRDLFAARPTRRRRRAWLTALTDRRHADAERRPASRWTSVGRHAAGRPHASDARGDRAMQHSIAWTSR